MSLVNDLGSDIRSTLYIVFNVPVRKALVELRRSPHRAPSSFPALVTNSPAGIRFLQAVADRCAKEQGAGPGTRAARSVAGVSHLPGGTVGEGGGP